MTNIINIQSLDQFNTLIETSSKPVLVDFWATWCPPCKMMNPVLDKLSETETTVTIAKVDVDELPEISALYNIRSIPTILTFVNGSLTATGQAITGAVPPQKLQAYIRSL